MKSSQLLIDGIQLGRYELPETFHIGIRRGFRQKHICFCQTPHNGKKI